MSRKQARRGTHKDAQVERSRREVVLEHGARHDRYRICNIELHDANTPFVSRASANERGEGHCAILTTENQNVSMDALGGTVDAVNCTVQVQDAARTCQMLDSG